MAAVGWLLMLGHCGSLSLSLSLCCCLFSLLNSELSSELAVRGELLLLRASSGVQSTHSLRSLTLLLYVSSYAFEMASITLTHIHQHTLSHTSSTRASSISVNESAASTRLASVRPLADRAALPSVIDRRLPPFQLRVQQLSTYRTSAAVQQPPKHAPRMSSWQCARGRTGTSQAAGQQGPWRTSTTRSATSCSQGNLFRFIILAQHETGQSLTQKSLSWCSCRPAEWPNAASPEAVDCFASCTFELSLRP